MIFYIMLNIIIRYRFIVILCLIPATFCGEESIFGEKNPSNNYDWWENTIMYQLYPRSFQDSDGDGIGDLKGITQRLDHFIDLGIETLWIGPIFKSPMDDMGYDVENLTMIDPVFGTIEDFDELVSEMNKRNLKLITDFVPNHSSYKCKWFQESILRNEKYDNYYVWRNAKNHDQIINDPTITPIAPNNWTSIFGYSMWTWNDVRKQFYLHQFTPKQPDFNLRNPDVHKEFLDILEYWMDKGVAGFRFDAVRFLYEYETFEDEFYYDREGGANKYSNYEHNLTLDRPEDVDIIFEWRSFLDNYSKNKNTFTRIISTESYSPINVLMQYYGNSSSPGAQIPFNFGFVEIRYKPNIVNSVNNVIRDWIIQMPKNTIANWVMENHDNPRISTKFGPQMIPLFTAIKLALPGIDVTYYGSEIGMEDTLIRPDQLQDHHDGRDGERCPMLWDTSINAGFSQAKIPWLPVNPNYYKLNVETQKSIPTSNYNFYKKMSQLRTTNTLKYGGLQTYNVSETVFILRRYLKDHESYIVVTNFGTETETIKFFNVVKNLKNNLYVYLRSTNSLYAEGSVISVKSANESLLELRPQSVVIFTDKELTPGSGSTQTTSNFIFILCSFLFARFFYNRI